MESANQDGLIPPGITSYSKSESVVDDVGRKSLSGGSTHSPALNLRMPQAEFDAFDQLARRRGVKRSALARQVLEDYLAEHLDELA